MVEQFYTIFTDATKRIDFYATDSAKWTSRKMATWWTTPFFHSRVPRTTWWNTAPIGHARNLPHHYFNGRGTCPLHHAAPYFIFAIEVCSGRAGWPWPHSFSPVWQIPCAKDLKIVFYDPHLQSFCLTFTSSRNLLLLGRLPWPLLVHPNLLRSSDSHCMCIPSSMVSLLSRSF